MKFYKTGLIMIISLFLTGCKSQAENVRDDNLDDVKELLIDNSINVTEYEIEEITDKSWIATGDKKILIRLEYSPFSKEYRMEIIE